MISLGKLLFRRALKQHLSKTDHGSLGEPTFTDPRHRRKGHARAIMTELLAWFYAHVVRRIEMNATRDGDAL